MVSGYFDIELSINDLQIPDAPNCTYGYLAIYDSGVEGENLIDKLCGSLDRVKRQVIRSKDSVLYLRFKSDGVHTGRGSDLGPFEKWLI